MSLLVLVLGHVHKLPPPLLPMLDSASAKHLLMLPLLPISRPPTDMSIRYLHQQCSDLLVTTITILPLPLMLQLLHKL
jgi:hypothetical protein